jgi:hypothetical protein
MLTIPIGPSTPADAKMVLKVNRPIYDQARTALADSGPPWTSPEQQERIEAQRATILSLMAERDALRAELKEEQDEYEALSALLKRRFPQNADGSFPDFAIEDVLRENERMRVTLRQYATHVAELSYHGEQMVCDLCGATWNNGRKRNEPATTEIHESECMLYRAGEPKP